MTITETTNESDVKLRECPFCDEAAYRHKHLDRCACSNNTCWLHKVYMTIEDWNTRHTDHLLKMAADALREAIPKCNKWGGCDEFGIWLFTDEDGREYLCDKHKGDNFYTHGRSTPEPEIVKQVKTLLTLQQHGYGKE